MPRRSPQIHIQTVEADCAPIEADAAWLRVISILLKASNRGEDQDICAAAEDRGDCRETRGVRSAARKSEQV